MKIFTCKQTRDADTYTIENEPVSSIELMERAAEKLLFETLKIYPECSRFEIFVGCGNNGGDGLAVARLLAERNKDVAVHIVHFSHRFSDDFSENLKRLQEQNKVFVTEIFEEKDFPDVSPDALIIDALFGSGLTRPLSALSEYIILKINMLGNEVLSVDIPSGLFGEQQPAGERIAIRANHTVSFQYPYLSFFFPENEAFTGNFHVADIGIHPAYIQETPTTYYFIEKKDVQLKKRTKFSHKGNYGHVLIFAGKRGSAGASLLAVQAALRTGCGKLTAVVPSCNVNILQIGSPESLLYIDSQQNYLSDMPTLDNFHSAAIGPGIGFAPETQSLLFSLISTSKFPLVIDADAITILGEHPEMLKKIPQESILTPHVKEFERLVGKCADDFDRLQKQIYFAKKYRVILILKGAHTAIALPEGLVYFNSTGNPGMATAGSGDVLTGIIASLLAQQYSSREAAIFGVFLHGLAGDRAAAQKGEYALIASDIIACLPECLQSLHESSCFN